MALVFPSGPSLNDTYADWTWNGSQWVRTSGGPFLPLTGGTLTGPLQIDPSASGDGLTLIASAGAPTALRLSFDTGTGLQDRFSVTADGYLTVLGDLAYEQVWINNANAAGIGALIQGGDTGLIVEGNTTGLLAASGGIRVGVGITGPAVPADSVNIQGGYYRNGVSILDDGEYV